LDKETSGLLIITDDGQLVHRLTSPKKHVEKVYRATLAHALIADEAEQFASGTLFLRDDPKPLLPATLEVIEPTTVRLTIVEGRYHQVRRMFAAVGNHVVTLHRERVGRLTLDELAPGQWRLLADAEITALGQTP
jgi:16S rRNA pseudouridine516 synthase